MKVKIVMQDTYFLNQLKLVLAKLDFDLARLDWSDEYKHNDGKPETLNCRKSPKG